MENSHKQSSYSGVLDDKNYLPEHLTVVSVEEFYKLPLIKNRRFMYCNDVLILGEEDFLWKKGELCKSHAVEFHESGVRGKFDDFCRGWIGYSKEYPDGIIHFAPMITSGFQPHLDAAIDFMQKFKNSCKHDQTVVRGFVMFAEQKLDTLAL